MGLSTWGKPCGPATAPDTVEVTRHNLDSVVPAMDAEPCRELHGVERGGSIAAVTMRGDVRAVVGEDAQAVPLDIPEVSHWLISGALAG